MADLLLRCRCCDKRSRLVAHIQDVLLAVAMACGTIAGAFLGTWWALT